MKPKVDSSKRPTKLTNLARCTERKKKREKSQITKIWNERENIKTDFTDIKMIIKAY